MPTKTTRNNRQIILDRLRSRLVDRVKKPDLSGEGSIGQAAIEFDDPVSQFLEAVKLVGGESHRIGGTDEIDPILSDHPAYGAGCKICSLMDAPVKSNVDLAQIEDPHELADLDLVLAMGTIGVAENGAIWITDKNIPHRASLFITQHLVLCVPSSAIVHNMHQAYRSIGAIESTFGVFIAGPSKTADIEQSLVLGAHGCRSLVVFAID